ncbi:thiol reductase thioredoxin [Bacillus cereus]|nr:thiol reductase thioredoxin [Bacillus cereus]
MFNFKDSKPQTYKDISLKELQMKLDSEKDIKVYVYKTSCVACQELKPILDQVISENQLNIFALNMDIEENIDVTFLNKNKIFRTPTLLHFKNGEEVDRLLGVQTKQDLNQFLNK